MNDESYKVPEPSPQQGADVQNAVAVALAEEKKKKKKKKLIILAVIVGVILIIGIAAGKGGESTDKGGKVEPIASGEAAQQEEAPETEAPKEEKIKAGNAVSTDDLKVSYVSCDTNYTKYSEYMKPDGGNKVVRAEFKFENISGSDVSLSSFECYADDKKCDEFYGPNDYASPTLESVSPGRSFDAVIYFQVPEGAKSIELEYEDNFWSNEKIVFVIE